MPPRSIATQSPTAVRVLLVSPLYRGAAVALFLSGLGFSAVAPLIARFIVDELGGSLAAAGFFYLTNLTAPVAGYLVGRSSDRTGRRLGPFRMCAVAGFAGWAAIGFSTQLWMPFVISAVVLGLAGAATSQLFAAIHDELAAHPSDAGDGVVSYVRMALTLGWVVGPFAGAVLAAQADLRTVLLLAAACTLAQIVPLGTLRDRPVAASRSEDSGERASLASMLPLFAFTGLYVLVYAAEPIRYAYLPLHMAEQQYPAALSGAVIAVQPLVEIAVMPLAFMVARRTGILPLMVAAAVLGGAANLLFAYSGSPYGLLAGQVLMGGVWGVFAGLGIIVAQRLLPTAIATASAVFISAPAISSALGGSLGGLGVTALGLPHVFVIPSALAFTASVGLLVFHRARRRGAG